ncbi:hypothetical protein VTI74DRAFT_11650 [Chaetomium olivicolor]
MATHPHSTIANPTTTPPTPATITAECTICTTPLPHPSRLPSFPCSHTHCLACLRRNLTSAMDASTPFHPVQCCPGQRLPTNLLRQHLGLRSGEVDAYRQRLAEYDAAVKVYCWKEGCGRFIPKGLRYGRVGRCIDKGCLGRTCVKCGGKAHGNLVVKGRCEGAVDVLEFEGEGDMEDGVKVKVGRRREGEDLEGFRRVVREMGWKSCPSCRRWVEKTEGCNHITCLCGCEFCYRCGQAPWDDHGECSI